jgi:D-alanine-D-alanine ligase
MTLPTEALANRPAMTTKKLTITVLMGGCSRERDVSLQSGESVAAALATLGHRVKAVDVRPGDVGKGLVADTDVIFLALHGRWGEDGGIQDELEALGACYTFSGPLASRLAMDKVRAKERFIDEGIPTPAYRVAVPNDDSVLVEAMDALGSHLVVKPVSDGSSIGISMPETAVALREAVREVWALGDTALIERRILGREFTVGVLGDAALPIIEIRTPGGWYNYHYKYVSGATQYLFDHGLEAGAERRIVEAALASHEALGCRDLSRVDVLLSEHGDPQVLEVNTIPGFTSHSLVPKAAAHAGIPMAQLCERIAGMALARKRG